MGHDLDTGMDSMSEGKLTLRLDGPGITLMHLEQAAKEFGKILGEVTSKLAHGNSNAVRWLIADARAGSLELATVAQLAADSVPSNIMPEITRNVVHGLATIDERAERPPYFSDAALRSAKRLAELIGNGLTAVHVSDGRERATVTPRSSLHVDELIGPKLESFGTVEGTLEAVSVHGERSFAIYETLTGRRIECHFGNRVPLEDILAAFTRRVAARGMIRSRTTGERLSIEVYELRVLPEDRELPSADDVRGILGGNG